MRGKKFQAATDYHRPQWLFVQKLINPNYPPALLLIYYVQIYLYGSFTHVYRLFLINKS